MKQQLTEDEKTVAQHVLGVGTEKFGISEIAKKYNMNIPYVHSIWVRAKQKAQIHTEAKEIGLFNRAWEGMSMWEFNDEDI